MPYPIGHAVAAPSHHSLDLVLAAQHISWLVVSCIGARQMERPVAPSRSACWKSHLHSTALMALQSRGLYLSIQVLDQSVEEIGPPLSACYLPCFLPCTVVGLHGILISTPVLPEACDSTRDCPR